MAQQGMILRNNQLVGRDTTPTQMPPANRPAFEESCYHIFARWTALQLGIKNEWGGSDSTAKANELLKDCVNWFYSQKGDPDQYTLEDVLDDRLQSDFNVLADDDSPYQVARSLINTYFQVARGDFSYLETLRQMQPAATNACQQEKAQDPEADESSSSDEDDDGDDTEMEDAAMDTDEAPVAQPMNKQQPMVDDDGFTVVQRKGRR